MSEIMKTLGMFVIACSQTRQFCVVRFGGVNKQLEVAYPAYRCELKWNNSVKNLSSTVNLNRSFCVTCISSYT